MSGTLEISDSEIYKIKIVKWKLENFNIGSGLTSPQFTFDGNVYYIGIGCVTISYDGNISTDEIYLSAVDKKIGENFEYVIECKKPSGSVLTVKNGPLFFNSREFERNLLNKYGPIVGNLTAICAFHHGENTNRTKVNLKAISSQTDALESILTLSKNFKELLASGRHADVTIKVGNKEFKAHKSVLAARSPVLDSMFSSDMLESNTGILQITDTDEGTFEDFLTFIYTARIEEVSLNKIKALYEIADKYNLPELKTECVKRFMVEMSVESVCDALRVSTLHDEKPLLKTATEFFIDNAEKVFESKCWILFLKDHSDVANELLKKCFKARLK